VTFWPSRHKYRDFEFSEGDSDDVLTEHWDCPTCSHSMPSLKDAKKDDVIECNNCGTGMKVTHASMQVSVTRVEMVEQGDEGGLHLVLVMENGMRLVL
jgi:transcription elongation factor Elf1